MEKKVILYVGGFELPDKNAAAQRVMSNGKIFRDLEFEVVFVGIDKELTKDSHIKDTKSKVSGFDTWAVPYPQDKRSWFKYITSISHLEYIIDNYYKDNLYGVVCYNYPAVSQYKIKSMCFRNKAFYIADATEWYSSESNSFLFTVIKWLDTSLRIRLINRLANGVITTSRYLSGFYNEKKCITVELPTLYDIESLGARDLKNNNKDNAVNLMYAGSPFNAGRINKNKSNIKDRLDKVILLLGRVYEVKTNFVLNIYGLTRDNYLSVFPEHENILTKLSNHIFFHGRKTHLEIIQFTKESDYTIFLREIDRVVESGFPSKFSESISCGVPVIVNPISNIVPYISEGMNCYSISLDDEKEQLNKMLFILNQSRVDIEAMKVFCEKNKIFSYKEFVAPVRSFMSKLKSISS